MTGYFRETKGEASLARSGWLAMIRASEVSVSAKKDSRGHRPYRQVAWTRNVFWTAARFERTAARISFGSG